MATLLMERTYSGVEVFLWWHGANTVTLDVSDPLGIVTGVPVPSDEALVAFEHPYLYLDAERPDPFAPKLRVDDDIALLHYDADAPDTGTEYDPRDHLPA